MESVELLALLAKLKSLEDKIDVLTSNQCKPSTPNQSTILNELFSALAKAQSEMKIAQQSGKNSQWGNTYVTLKDMVEATRPSLSKNGLCVIQQIMPDVDGKLILHSILGHNSGQYIESQIRIVPAKADVQGMGSHITYLKRYAYSALIGCVSSEDPDDDDGEKDMRALNEKKDKGIALTLKRYKDEEETITITKEQLEELEYELSDCPDIAERVLEGLQIHTLADMPKKLFIASANKIRQIKAIRDGKK